MELDRLNKILDAHKLWLSSYGAKGEKADLRYANLSDANLSGADLRRADLRYADLSDADLRRADLSDADLSDANLRGADLRYANLSGADLSDADLDFSAFPLWCGGLDVHIDDRIATQLLYHLARNIKYSKNVSLELKKAVLTKKVIKAANNFHRTDVERLEDVEDD